MPDADTSLGGSQATFPNTSGSDLLDAGEAFGLKASDIRHRLECVRALLKRILRGSIREYVSSDDEIEPGLRKAVNE